MSCCGMLLFGVAWRGVTTVGGGVGWGGIIPGCGADCSRGAVVSASAVGPAAVRYCAGLQVIDASCVVCPTAVADICHTIKEAAASGCNCLHVSESVCCFHHECSTATVRDATW